LLKRLRRIEDLPPAYQRAVLNLVDAMLDTRRRTPPPARKRKVSKSLLIPHERAALAALPLKAARLTSRCRAAAKARSPATCTGLPVAQRVLL